MKISLLLEKHNSFHNSAALPTNLGDAYLINKNRIYAKIRQASLSFNFSYSNHVDQNYFALPLSQLDLVMRNKVIPYIDNVSVLTELVKKNILNFSWNDIQDNLKRNHIFHESCHAVARSVSAQFISEGSNEERQILRFLIEESFANTCELLAVQDVDDPCHKIFYERNSYTFLFENKANIIKNINLVGEFKFFKFMLLAYLCSNFLMDHISDKMFLQMLEICEIDVTREPALAKSLKIIAKITASLDPRFRWVTTSFYLRLNAIKSDYPANLNFNFLALIKSGSEFEKVINQVCMLATK